LRIHARLFPRCASSQRQVGERVTPYSQVDNLSQYTHWTCCISSRSTTPKTWCVTVPADSHSHAELVKHKPMSDSAQYSPIPGRVSQKTFAPIKIGHRCEFSNTSICSQLTNCLIKVHPSGTLRRTIISSWLRQLAAEATENSLY
jgi:hypothetical protein